MLGIEKFLKVGWSKDEDRGEANFDIDKEKLEIGKNSLFPEYYVPNKIQLFEDRLEKMIRDEREVTEKDVYLYTIEHGLLPNKHARPVLSNLKAAGIIDYEGILALSYSSLSRRGRVPKTIKVK